MIHPEDVSAVLVTRGDVQLYDIIRSIRSAGILDIVIWDNSERDDLGCYGRYAGIAEARKPWIFHQDDDLIAPVDKILKWCKPVYEHVVFANNEAGEPWRLTGRGTIFHRDRADCFDRYTAEYGNGPSFHRIADIVFAYSNHYFWKADLGWQDLPWATGPDRMYQQPRHYEVREQARDRVRRLNGYKEDVSEPL